MNEFLKHLEPAAVETTATGINLSALSIAVSLKRIADEIAGSDKKLGLTDALYDIAQRTER